MEKRSKPGSQFGNLRGICKQIPGSCSLPKKPAPNFSRSDFQDTRRWMGDTWWHLGSSGIPLFHPRPSNLTDFLPQFPSSLPKNHNGSSWWSFSPAGIVQNWEFQFFFRSWEKFQSCSFAIPSWEISARKVLNSRKSPKVLKSRKIQMEFSS